MSASVDMSLDDIIKRQRNSERTRGQGRGGRGHVQGRSFGGRMNRMGPRNPLAVNARPSTYIISKLHAAQFAFNQQTLYLKPFKLLVPGIRWRIVDFSGHIATFHCKPFGRKRSFPWKTDLFEDSIRAAGVQGIEIGTKLYVSNLDCGVTNDDIRELFSEIGDVKRYAIHYDKTGRPGGSAEVVYTRRSDALLALKRYNNVLLDGKPMKIEIVGAKSEVPFSAQINVTGLNGRKKRTVVMPGQGTARGPALHNNGTGNNGRRLGGFRNGRGRGRGRGGRGRGRKQPVEKSAEQLDKDLDSYHAEAMNTS